MTKPGDEMLFGCGVGLRREHFGAVLAEHADVPFFEAISENFMAPGGRPRHVLATVRRDYPVLLHGVSLSVGSAEPLNAEYLRRLRELIAWVEPAIVSDHLCFTGVGGHNSHDLLPLPFTEEAVRTAAGRIAQVQDALGRKILVENISTYIRFRHSTMTEWEFVTAVVQEAGCGLLLDVNNVYVNARNHGFDPEAYLDGLPQGVVGQYHVAGHEDHRTYVIDTHDQPVPVPVWSLFCSAVRRFGPAPTILERDGNVPELSVLLEEADTAQSILYLERGRCAA